VHLLDISVSVVENAVAVDVAVFEGAKKFVAVPVNNDATPTLLVPAVLKLGSTSLTKGRNKLECLSLAVLSSLSGTPL